LLTIYIIIIIIHFIKR